MPLTIHALVDEINKSDWRGAIAVTGCSSAIVDLLLSRGGGSNTLLDARVPYSTEALVEFIGKTPTKFCSDEVAHELASASYSIGANLNSDFSVGHKIFGLGITSTLRRKGPEREGRVHQAFISLHTAEFVALRRITLNPKISRKKQDGVVALVALIMLGGLIGLTTALPAGTVKEEYFHKKLFPDGLSDLIVGISDVYVTDNETFGFDDRVVIPGSFNPFHDGHYKMSKFAEKECPIFEMSISNVDKRSLSGYEIMKRLATMPDDAIVVVTNSPTFLQKSEIFRGAAFLVGIDTWDRIVDIKYYGGSRSERDLALETLRDRNCKFVVLGRLVDGEYQTLSTEEVYGLASGVPEEQFRIDISSTQIRKEKESDRT